MRDIRIGITGHRGLLGSLLADRLHRTGLHFDTYGGDVTDDSSFTRWIDSTRPQVLFHFAAMVPVQRVLSEPERAMHVNAIALLSIAKAIATRASDSWVFLASTSHVYGPGAERSLLSETSPTMPQTLYGATKLAGEYVLMPLAKHLGIPLCVGRIFSYFHERQSPEYLVPNLVRCMQHAKHGDAIEIRDADSIRDFLHAEMVVDAILGVCAQRYSGTINIASGRATSVEQLARRLISRSGKELLIKSLPSSNPIRLVGDISKLKSAILTG